MSAKVNVLLSTYNGEKFLREQLDSILAQSYSYRYVVIHIRDDGSTDSTPEILRQYAEKYPGIKVEYGHNLGVVQSFFTLLRNANDSCQYFAFCDQDDVWLENKVKDAVGMLEQSEDGIPLLYCSRLEYVDANLNHLGYSRIPKRLGFGNTLVENVATGCTILINREAREITLDNIPDRLIMHDWWILLVVMAFGKVIFDNRVNIRYRQHGGNVVGGTANQLQHFLQRLGRFLSNGNNFRPSDQVREFSKLYGSLLEKEKEEVVKELLVSKQNMWFRVKFAFTLKVWRQSLIDTLILRILVILGRC